MGKENLIDFDRYIISENGRIWSKHYKCYIGNGSKNNAYKSVNLTCKDGKKRDYLVHRVIAYYFIPNPENKPEVDHINGNKQDNRVENLRWVTSSENSRNEITLKRNIEAQHKHRVYAYKDGIICGEYESENEAARQLGVLQGNINKCAHGKIKTAYGYKWSYTLL